MAHLKQTQVTSSLLLNSQSRKGHGVNAMSRFEYLSVLVSIVIALGLSEVTISWGRVFQRRIKMHAYWLHVFWSLFSLFLMVQFWWGFWRYRTIEDWSLGALLLTLTVVITLTLCALMLVPRARDAEGVDSRQVYFDNAKSFFSLGALYIVLVTTMDVVVLGSPLIHVENIFRGFGAAAALAMAWLSHERMHESFAILGLVILLGFLATTSIY